MYTLKVALEDAEAAIGRVDAQVLVGEVLGVDRAYMVANPLRILTESEDARIDSIVAQRSLGMPVAYLIGRREFWSRPFRVTPDVLIPRPETEILVEAALENWGRTPISRFAADPAASGKLGSDPSFPAVLDLGTGSGAIAITLALEMPHAHVTAVDTSDAALGIARDNAATLGASVEFLHGAWYESLAGRRFDLIVSNPPYVAAGDAHLGQGDLRFEPAGALTDGSADGLDSIRAIVQGASAHLHPGGRLLLEHGYDQAVAVAALLRAAGFASIVSVPDLAGIPRVAGGTLPA